MIYRLLKYSYLLIFFLISNLIYSQGYCPPSVDESNRALSFDGNDDFVTIPYIFNPNDDFTISFWFKKSDYGSGSSDIVISQAVGDAGGGSEPRSTIIASKTNPNRRIYSSIKGDKYMNQGLEIDKWTHVALVHDTDGGSGNGNIQWYYNGIQHGDPHNVNADSNNDGEFYLGKNAQNSQFFKGLIDEVRIWNTTRTFAQIQSDIHNDANTSDPSLLVHYNMGTVTSTILVNNSSYGAIYNGVLSNGASGTSASSSIGKLTSFGYEKNSYTKAEKNPIPVVLGDSGGVFSSSAGLTLNAATGEIDLSASTPGTYSINYTIPSSCSTASSKSISITPSNTIDFSYPQKVYCITDGIITPTLNGPSGGTFYSDPPGLYIDRNNGSIVTASSTVDDYDVYYLRGTPAPNAINWTTIGDIKAKAGSSGSIPIQNNFGISVRLNAAGNVLITNAINSDNNADNAGEMKAYFNNGGTWERIGHNIGGESDQPRLTDNKNTAHIAVNDAGDIIAMSNPQSDSGCSDCGRVIVLKRKNGIWSQLGSEIHGENANVGKKFFGLSIALNSAGNVLAIGDEKDKEAGANKGIVHIYEFNGTDWILSLIHI